MPQLAQCLRFNLPDALTRDAKFLADFLQRTALTVAQAKTPLDHAALAVAQLIQHFLHLLTQ